MVELYQHNNTKQSFLETSCGFKVRNRPCVFPWKHRFIGYHSRCVQQHTYSYAIIREAGAEEVSVFCRTILSHSAIRHQMLLMTSHT